MKNAFHLDNAMLKSLDIDKQNVFYFVMAASLKHYQY